MWKNSIYSNAYNATDGWNAWTKFFAYENRVLISFNSLSWQGHLSKDENVWSINFFAIGKQEKLRFSLPPKLRGRPTKFLTQGQGTPVATNAPGRKPHLWVCRVDSSVELLQDLFKRKNKKTKEALEPTHLATNSVEHTQQGMRFVENRSVGRVRHPQVEPKSSLPDPTTAVPKTYYRCSGAHTIMLQTVYHKFYEIFSIFTSVVASSNVQSSSQKYYYTIDHLI